MPKTILIADDEPNIRDVVRFALNSAGFECDEAHDGQMALEMFDADRHALVILDIKMPHTDGLEVCRIIRQTSDVEIILLSSLDDEIDRVVGLELGADDYVTKPFSPRELVARVKARLRKRGAPSRDPTSEPVTHIGNLTIDERQFAVRWSDVTIPLTAKEFALLLVLAKSPGRVFSRSQLMRSAYGDGTIVSERTIDSHIRRIRARFAEVGTEAIDTAHGFGYRLAKSISGKR